MAGRLNCALGRGDGAEEALYGYNLSVGASLRLRRGCMLTVHCTSPAGILIR